MPLIILSVVAFFFFQRRNKGGENQPPPPPLTQEASEYYKVQPASPVFNPANANLQRTSYYVRSPFFIFTLSVLVAYLYDASFIQNPNDPTTFPPQMGDGQSSLTYITPLSPQGPHGQGQGQGQGRYSGIPEI